MRREICLLAAGALLFALSIAACAGAVSMLIADRQNGAGNVHPVAMENVIVTPDAVFLAYN
jgi:hypothetical protein